MTGGDDVTGVFRVRRPSLTSAAERTLFDVTDDAVFVLDRAGDVADANRAARNSDYLRPGVDEIVGRPLTTLLRPELRDRVGDAAGQTRCSLQVDGGRRWCRIQWTPITRTGVDDGTLVVLRDETDRRALDRSDERSSRVDGSSLRELYQITSDPASSFETTVDRMLELGQTHLGLDVGLLAAIDGTAYTVGYAVSPDGAIEPGDVFDLGETFCERVVETEDPVGFTSAAAGGVTRHPAYRELGIESYLGAPVVVDGDVYGTLNFSSARPRERPFTPDEETFVRLMAQWIGTELSRRRSGERAVASRDSLRQIIDTLPQLVFAKDDTGEFLLANETVADAYGTTVEELEGSTDDDFADSAAEAERFRADDRAVIESGEPKHVPEEVLTTADGERRVLETRKIPYEPVEADRPAVLGVATDITERQARESELRMQSAAMKASMDGISILDADEEYIYMNRAHAEVFGYEPGELIGSTWRRLYGDEEIERIEREAFPELAETGEWRGETVGRTRDGEPAYQEISLSLVGDGKLICTNRDIAERKRRERELERQRTRLRVLFDESPDGVVVHDAEGSVIEVNATQAESLRYGREELASMNVAAFEDEVSRAELTELWEGMADGEIMKYDGRHRRRNGSTFPVEVWVSKVEVLGEERFISLSRDATERRERERELEQFASVASHDLREPLRMVSSYLQLLDRRYGDELDDDAGEFIDYAVDGAERMREMIQGLLEYSRVGTRGQELRPTALGAVYEEARQNLRVAIDESEAELTVGDLPTVHGDPRQLVQLLQNLLTNAIKYAGDDPPRIDVSAEHSGGQWLITVSDDGIGIDPDQTEQVFELFERLHGQEAYAGTGIGLTVAQKIVTRHGGDIWVESEPGGGSTFSFTLPEVTGDG